MAKDLIIVESPAKTRTLEKFLGGDYELAASVGHVRDLPKKDMGIGEDYEPVYEVLKEKRKVVSELRKAAKGADRVLLAPDPDREGEAIAWHIAQLLEKEVSPEDIQRITFNEITEKAVREALEHPGSIDRRKVEAQQARRILDRLMGFKLSPLLWKKVKRGLSAGRVQSVALKMACDREDEIEAFEPEEYWNISARLEAAKPPVFEAKLHRIDDERAEVGDGETAERITTELREGSFTIASIERRESKSHPKPPFITSQLQQKASHRFRFSVKKTMTLAQRLYEGKEIGDRGAVGLITYMRTDSTRTAESALEAVREHIAVEYGESEMPKKPRRFKSKKGAQEAHEAIRPTFMDLPPEAVSRYLDRDELKLYTLIWQRFVASQMNPAVYDVTTVDVANGDYVLRASGRVLKEKGFLAVYFDDDEVDESASDLPDLSEGEELDLVELEAEQKFTQPPARYSEATLVKALEENGVGRPSTYAAILATLTDRAYAEKHEGRFHPNALGRVVNRLLQEGFHDIINESYTAELEEKLDEIEEGDLDWKDALVVFDAQFDKDLATAEEEMPDVKRQGLPTDEECPECGAELRIRFGRFGGFYGCENYPDCKYTRNLQSEEGDESVAEEEEIPPCEECGGEMVLRRSRYGPFYGCSNYPECKNTRPVDEGERTEPKGTGVTCPECGEGEIAEKRTRRGKIFYSCDRYPECEYALWNRPLDRECPECGAPFVVEKTTKSRGRELLCVEEECDYREAAPAEEQDERGEEPAAAAAGDSG